MSSIDRFDLYPARLLGDSAYGSARIVPRKRLGLETSQCPSPLPPLQVWQYASARAATDATAPQQAEAEPGHLITSNRFGVIARASFWPSSLTITGP